MDMPNSPARASLMLCVATLLASCGHHEPASTGAKRAVTPEQREALVAARDDLVQTLGARLAEAMTQSPDEAIRVCSREAIPLTQSIAEKHGVRMGRTSARLRNPSNTPPAWAADLIDAEPTEPIFLPTSTTGARALLPITLDSRCVTCHGSPEQIPDPVRVALDAAYPDDNARGFAPGDIRGYVWVEQD
ncbi:MAG: DUF3365 domain-containing protein [Phycisphaeraceae bacterium]|nr:MAG: DUF3365 domain-containing protein [Phycisphaeraceae bacterium]